MKQPIRRLADPCRHRRDAALDLAEAALRELLACVDLADGGHNGVPEDRHDAAKTKARQALADIETLREGDPR